MADAAATAGPDAVVPTCPGWVVRDLVRHMGGVHRWATGYVAGGRTEVWDVDLDEVVGAWPDDADLAGWLTEGCEALAAALDAAPPDLECWTFLPRSLPVGHVGPPPGPRDGDPPGRRRARGRSSAQPVHPGLRRRRRRRAAGMLRAPPLHEAARRASCLHGRAVHRRGRGLAAAHRGRGRHDGSHRAAGGRRRLLGAGRATDLYLALWNRAGPEALVVEGDTDVLTLFLDTVQVRWA